MHVAIDNMMKKYDSSKYTHIDCIKEVMQELVLYALGKTDFYDRCAFYGGTALRIFYGLDRFSEDLDFSLKVPDEKFSLEKYIPTILKEVNSFGLDFDAKEKIKSIDSNTKSAFLKGNTREHILIFFNDKSISQKYNINQTIKVKFEVDISPPDYATYETKYLLQPYPTAVTLYDKSSLFAGKLHAILCRKWKNRIKGRDFYDYIFYLSNNIKVNLQHLQQRLIQTGFISDTDKFDEDILRKFLINRFCNIDFNVAKDDVIPFIQDKSRLDIWSKEFFIAITENYKFV